MSAASRETHTRNMKLSVVIPVYNERDTIAEIPSLSIRS